MVFHFHVFIFISYYSIYHSKIASHKNIIFFGLSLEISLSISQNKKKHKNKNFVEKKIKNKILKNKRR